MLLAEIHGKYDLAIQDDEDYLTSTVFSHLRYVPPGIFWHALLSKTRTVPIHDKEESLTAVLGEECHPRRYEKLDVLFWPKCSGLGEPELAMCFTGGGQKPLVILVEVKLWAAKSGYGEHDQLMRYLQIADSIGSLNPPVPPKAKVVVLYITPREAIQETLESLARYGDSEESRRRLFRLQWQDVIEAIDESAVDEPEMSQMILKDVRGFLRVRRLEYFKGFHRVEQVEALSDNCGEFYVQEGRFRGFQASPGLSRVQVVKGAW